MFFERVRFFAIMAVLGFAVATADGTQGPERPWPPGLQPVPAESPVLSPAEAMKTFHLAPGYRLELVASEPMVQDPILMEWDLEGRLWVIEMPGYMRDIVMSRQFDPDTRIVILEDTDHDGRMDKRTVFADNLVLARSLKVLDQGVLVAEPPNVWLMRDTDGDLRADTKELVATGYGQLVASIEHNANGFHWALDNRMHTSNSDVYLRLRPGYDPAAPPAERFEVLRTISRGQWGVTHDDGGRIFRNTNENALNVDFVPTPYFLRNPALTRTAGSYQSMATPGNNLNEVWPVRPNRGVNRGYVLGVLKEDGSLARYSASTSPIVYRGDRLPAELYGNVFIADLSANVVSRIVLDDDGTLLKARKAYDGAEFLASTDERFRPVYLSAAPDGTIYIADMYRGIIQQRSDITEYLRDHILARKLDGPTGLGRIYRIVHDTTRRDERPSLTGASPERLVELLSHPNGWWRDIAQRLLVERRATSVAAALERLASRSADHRTRLHALWTLDGLNRIEPAVVATALEDKVPDVRASAIRIAERWLGEPGHPIHKPVMARLDDEHWAVRHQLAASVGLLPPGVREPAAARLLAKHGADPITVDAALSGLRGAEAGVLEQILRTEAAPGPGREVAIAVLASVVIRSAPDTAVQGVFASMADQSRPEWQRSALLRGAEIALLDAPMPGETGRRGGGSGRAGAAAPCPTCPGARGGPGGAYAFPGGPTALADQFVNPFTGARGVVGVGPVGAGSQQTVAARGGGGRGGRGGGGPQIRRLGSEPVELSRLAATDGELGTRAKAVLAGVEWPGKPGASAPVAPLTAAEARRFDAGADLYKTICAACHRADGRGEERIGPPLIAAPLALASPGVPVRIVLHGKQGPVGVMPGLGSALDDEQIAGVLTYIRREWGQAGAPVDPATVAGVRAQTAARTRPWTPEELAALSRSPGQ